MKVSLILCQQLLIDAVELWTLSDFVFFHENVIYLKPDCLLIMMRLDFDQHK